MSKLIIYLNNKTQQKVFVDLIYDIYNKKVKSTKKRFHYIKNNKKEESIFNVLITKKKKNYSIIN